MFVEISVFMRVCRATEVTRLRGMETIVARYPPWNCCLDCPNRAGASLARPLESLVKGWHSQPHLELALSRLPPHLCHPLQKLDECTREASGL